MLPPPDWPFADTSQSLRVAGVEWHVQSIGAGPELLLLHGAGGATHSWRGLAPLLKGYRLHMIDLPGQGFSRMGRRGRAGLDPMAADIVALCADQGWAPSAIIGHSAGAALALRLCEILPARPSAIIGINAALQHFQGVAGILFPVIARALSFAPFVGSIFAARNGTTAGVTRLITSMGSRLDAEGVEMYRNRVADPSHVSGTLSMMAEWRLDGLIARLPDLAVPCLLIAAAGDRAVPPQTSQSEAVRMAAKFHLMAEGGHLVHEEFPQEVADLILQFLDENLRTL